MISLWAQVLSPLKTVSRLVEILVMKEEDKCVVSLQEKYFLNTFPLIRHLIKRRLGVLNPDAGDDIFQTVALRLWQWITRKKEPQMSAEEWQRYANRATCNEIKRFYGSKFRKEISLSEIENDYEFISSGDAAGETPGTTESEDCSSLRHWWETIRDCSLRQKYALLLSNQDFVFELVSRRCCRLEEIAESLILSREELLTLIGRLPLSNEDIQRLLKIKTGDQLTVRQIWMARGKAKAKLKAARKGQGKVEKIKDDKTFIAGGN